ncbi:MAG: alkaline phosphatase D family protein [Nitrosopumilus sp.]|nr:alkaline phosphatase D family protein [Nitrosopumilus sp.]
MDFNLRNGSEYIINTSEKTFYLNCIKSNFSSAFALGLIFLLTTYFANILDYTAYAQQELNITHGVASGDVTNQSATIWSRSNSQSIMNVEYDTNENFSNGMYKEGSVANASTDFTVKANLEDLMPDTLYFYRVWFSDLSNSNNTSNPVIGKFITAPIQNGDFNNNSTKEIRFIWGADLGGQNYCRNEMNNGYKIFESMQSLNPHFFIANGDMIYADGICTAEGPVDDNNMTWKNIPGDFKSIRDPSVNWENSSEVEKIFVDHWKYNRNDPYLQNFLKNTSMYSQWDDHEVINDFGAKWPYWNLFNIEREGYPNIVKEGLSAFSHYSPIKTSTIEDNSNGIYRSFNWGKPLDLFILDARSYRDQNHVVDTPDNNKTLIGNSQLEWLKQGLLNSNATWKIVSSDVPISIPTGSNTSILGRDGWANGNETDYSNYTGFERELNDLFGFIDENKLKNIVFVTTDVHFPAFIKYDFDLDNDGNSTIIYELVSGPLSAFRGGVPFPVLDKSFNSTLLYGEGDIFNFGYVKIIKDNDSNNHLIADIRDTNGNPREGSKLEIAPR